MKLNTITRKANSKSEVNRLRREGYIPAILYIRNKAGETLAVKKSDFDAILRNVKPGHLPTTIFTLADEHGKSRKVIVKEIQYDITSYNVKHLDLEELVADHKIKVKVPIECVGAAECPGVKLGGVLRQPIRHARVQCLPKDMPTVFELDVKDLALRQTKRLSDLQMPETIRPLMDLKEVVAVIVKR